MNKYLSRMMAAGAASLALGFSMSGFAGPANPAYYYDGGSKRPITLEPALVAEFSNAVQRTASGSGPRSIGLTSRGEKFITLHAVPVNAGPMSNVFSASTPSSSVFHEGQSTSGRLMALPGGVIIHFKPEWSDAQITNWLASKSYIVQQKLNIQGSWYVVQSSPGQASLDLANKIHESGDVLSASPNWWKETVAK